MLAKYRGEFLGLFLTALGLFIFLALLGHHTQDPAFGRAGADGVRNFTGLFGAYISGLLFDLCGLSAWLIPLFLITGGVAFLRGRERRAALFLSGGLFVLSFSFLFSLFGMRGELWGRYPFSGGLLGMLGKALWPYFGRPGVFLLTIFLQLLALCLLSGLSPATLFPRVKQTLLALRSRLQRARPEEVSPPAPAFEPRLPEEPDLSEEPVPLPEEETLEEEAAPEVKNAGMKALRLPIFPWPKAVVLNARP